MSDITLTASARNSLLSLTGTASLMSRTQGRLTSGLKVASAIDDAISYFKAKGLTDRATDFSVRKDEIDQGISNLKSAINGTTLVDSILKQMKGIVNTVRTADSTTRTALSSQFNDLTKQINSAMQDASYQGLNLVDNSSASLTVYFNQGTSASLHVQAKNLRVSKLITAITHGVGGPGFNAVGDMLTRVGGGTGAANYTAAQSAKANAATAADNMLKQIGSAAAAAANGGSAGALAGTNAALAFANAQLTAANQSVTTATASGSASAITDAQNQVFGWTAALAGATAAVGAVTADQNPTVGYATASGQPAAQVVLDATSNNYRVANANEALATANPPAAIGYYDSTGKLHGAVATTPLSSISTLVADPTDTTGNTLVATASTTIVGFGTDPGYTVAAGDKIRLATQTPAANSITYASAAATGTSSTLKAVGAALGVGAAAPITGFSSLTSQTSISPVAVLDHISAMIDSATSVIRSQSALLGGNVTFLQSRMDFTSNYINTLQEGSGKLTLADLNEEGANLVSLQTRQQIGIQSLSIAGQQQQAILSLLR